MVYGDYDGRGRRKNKANSKPIKANFEIATAWICWAWIAACA
jgi:hypothetical protein